MYHRCPRYKIAKGGFMVLAARLRGGFTALEEA